MGYFLSSFIRCCVRARHNHSLMEVLKRINELVDISQILRLFTPHSPSHFARACRCQRSSLQSIAFSFGRRSLVVCLWIVLGFLFKKNWFLFWGVPFPVWWKGSSGKVAFVERFRVKRNGSLWKGWWNRTTTKTTTTMMMMMMRCKMEVGGRWSTGKHGRRSHGCRTLTTSSIRG